MIVAYLSILGVGFLVLIVMQLGARVKRPAYGKQKGDKTPHLQDAAKEAKKAEEMKNPRDSFREKPETMLSKLKSMLPGGKKGAPRKPMSLREDPRTLTAKVGGVKPLTEQAMENVPTESVDEPTSTPEVALEPVVDTEQIDKLETLLKEKNAHIEDLQSQIQHEQKNRNSFEQVKEALQEELEGLRSRNKELKTDNERLDKEVNQLKNAPVSSIEEEKKEEPKEEVSQEVFADQKEDEAIVSGDDLDMYEKPSMPGLIDDMEDDDMIPGPMKINDDDDGGDQESYSLPDDDDNEGIPILKDVFSVEDDADKDELKESAKSLEDSLLSDIEKDLNNPDK